MKKSTDKKVKMKKSKTLKQIKKGTNTCNMCHTQMKSIYVCANPACPNYALLQISMEKMPHAPGT